MNKNIAIIVGGWYFPKFLYEEVAKVKSPAGYNVDKYCVMHRMPPKEHDEGLIDQLFTNSLHSNIRGKLSQFDDKLFGQMGSELNPIQYQELKDLGFITNLVDNKIGDYYFINQWMEIYDVTMYDYIIFMHDDNYPSSEFQNILVDIFNIYNTNNWLYKFYDEKKNWDLDYTMYEDIGKKVEFDYIANSAVGNRKTARGSFSIWSRKFMEAIKEFPMENVTLNRTGKEDTPIGHDQLEDWNNVGHNLQVWVEQNGFMDKTYRLSPYYRISKYLMEGERGLISNINAPINFSEGFNHYKEYYK